MLLGEPTSRAVPTDHRTVPHSDHRTEHRTEQARRQHPAALLAAWVAETAGGHDDLKPRLLRLSDGRLVPLDVARWSAPADETDQTLLTRATGTVLDVGCGPGRLTVALHERGSEVLGLELDPSLPVLARRAGAPVLRGDVFAPVPRSGEWDSLLLADGNVGIGGDAGALLRRAAELVAPTGQVLVELVPGADPPPGPVRLEGLGLTSTWFRWALLGRAALPATAAAAGLGVRETWSCGGRAFAALSPA